MSTPIVRRRKKPVEVDTIQWTGANEADVQAFTGGASRFYALDDEDRANSDDPEATATVFDDLHCSWVLVYTGQHIVRGVKREFYPIAEDVLAETYEGADTPVHATCRTEGARLLEDAACDADWEKSPDYCAGLRAGAELLLANTGEEATAAAATATPDFFQVGHTYTRNLPYRAPELRPDFQCIGIGQHPTKDERRAFGFYRSGSTAPWGSSALGDEAWADGWVDVTEAGAR